MDVPGPALPSETLSHGLHPRTASPNVENRTHSTEFGRTAQPKVLFMAGDGTATYPTQ
jgi:hypothetical protein